MEASGEVSANLADKQEARGGATGREREGDHRAESMIAWPEKRRGTKGEIPFGVRKEGMRGMHLHVL